MVLTKTTKWRILLIEDEPIIKKTYARILTASGYEVETAPDGLTARNMAVTAPYDVIITDVHMPGLNGINLYESLKTTMPERLPKVIFISGDVLSTNIEDFCKAQGEEFLPKPFQPEELTELVKKIIMKIKVSKMK